MPPLPPSLDPDDDHDLSRGDFAYRRLLEGIRGGEFPAGRRLLELDLANRLNVSRTPVREAIRRLESEGLVEVAPGRGVMVIQPTRQQVRELYELRESLEGTAARLAALHASDSEIADLRRVLTDIEDVGDDFLEIARLNKEFHRLIQDAAHNRYLSRALTQLSDSLALLPGTTFQVPGRAERARVEHLAIVDAIETRNPEAAERAARHHIGRAGATRVGMMFVGPLA